MHFAASTRTITIGQNPEMADYGNPRGNIYAEAGVVYAEDDYGNRRAFYMPFNPKQDSFGNAVKLADQLQVRFDCLGKLPVAFDRWESTHPVYGSSAYENECANSYFG